MNRILSAVAGLVVLLLFINMLIGGDESAMKFVAREKGVAEGWPAEQQKLVHSGCDTGFFGIGGYGIVDLRVPDNKNVQRIELRKILNVLGWQVVSIRELDRDKAE